MPEIGVQSILLQKRQSRFHFCLAHPNCNELTAAMSPPHTLQLPHCSCLVSGVHLEVRNVGHDDFLSVGFPQPDGARQIRFGRGQGLQSGAGWEQGPLSPLRDGLRACGMLIRLRLQSIQV